MRFRAAERTAELEEKNEQLEQFNKLFVGRELRMAELKERIETLEKELAAKKGKESNTCDGGIEDGKYE